MTIRHVIGFLACVVAGLVGVQVWQMCHNEVDKRIYINNLSVAHQAGFAMFDYLRDHNEQYPDADRWEDELRPYLHGMSVTLQSRGGVPHRLAMNVYLSGHSDSDIQAPGRVIMFYETADRHPNAHGVPTDALRSSASPALMCAEGHPGYGRNGCGNSDDFRYSSDPKLMGLVDKK